MMGFRAILFTYILGGLTFLPLLVAAIVIPAWYLLPKAPLDDGGAARSDETSQESVLQDKSKELNGDAAASGTFAVLRRYDFQAAMTALNAKSSSNGGSTGSVPGVDGAATGDVAANESVYQSMYRSVFVGNKNNSSTSSLLQTDEVEGSPSRKRLPPANMLYIVLRHGHLMLYDSPAQVEVKHVISLAHHSVTLQAGAEEDEDAAESNIMEADLFTKRTAIVLTPIELPNGALQAPSQAISKPFYLFMATNIDKEDFYYALLSTRSRPPVPNPLDPEALIKLQTTLHSSSLSQETKALNALIGRVFLALHRTDALRNFIRGKLERKLNRIQKPTFIPSLRVQTIDLGDAGPAFSNLKLRDFDITGAISMTADVKYNGSLAVTLLAVAKLDLGSRFKVRTVDLLLKTTLRRISGTMLLKVKPPPSNRLWFCFDTMPDLDVRVEPVVSERKITYGFVLRAIEERVRTAFAEGLVKPNFDDVPMPFSDSRGGHVRGGLWSDPGEHEHAKQRPHSGKRLAERNEKTVSMPSFPQDVDSAVSSGLASNSDINLAKIRHSSTMPVDASPERSPRPPRPMRVPSVSSSSVAVDDLNVEPVRADDAGIRPPPPKRLWRARGTAAPQSQKDALEELRGVHSRAEQAAMPAALAAADEFAAPKRHSIPSDEEHGASADDSESVAETISTTSTIPATPRNFSIQSAQSAQSTPATSIASSRADPTQSRKANILAATVNATNAAKNWGWNAIQRRAMARQEVQTQEPMGRGQPLPPPGQPLPGPPKGIWGSVATMKRKPVGSLATRERQPSSVSQTSLKDDSNGKDPEPSPPAEGARTLSEDEFQAWQENTGPPATAGSRPVSASESESLVDLLRPKAASTRSSMNSKEILSVPSQDGKVSKVSNGDDASSIRSEKVPPPLPARPKRIDSSSGVPTPEKPNSSTSSLNIVAEDEVPSAPALRVPDAAASVIASENSTGSAIEEANAQASEDEAAVGDMNAKLESEGSEVNDFASNSAKIGMPGTGMTTRKSKEIHAEHKGGDEDEILSRVRARIKERTPAVEKDRPAAEEDFIPSVKQTLCIARS